MPTVGKHFENGARDTLCNETRLARWALQVLFARENEGGYANIAKLSPGVKSLKPPHDLRVGIGVEVAWEIAWCRLGSDS